LPTPRSALSCATAFSAKFNTFLSVSIRPYLGPIWERPRLLTPESEPQTRNLHDQASRHRRHFRRAEPDRPAAILAQRPQAHQPSLRSAIIIPFVTDHCELFQRRLVIELRIAASGGFRACGDKIQVDIFRLRLQPRLDAATEVAVGVIEYRKGLHNL